MLPYNIPDKYLDYAIIFVLSLLGLLFLYYLITRVIRKYEIEKEKGRRVEKIVNEIISYSHNFLEFLTVFHYRAKFNPDNIDSIGDKLTLNLSTLTSYSVLYFARKKDVNSWSQTLENCNEHYSALINRVVPPKPLSKQEFEEIRDQLNTEFTNLMKIVRSAKYI